MPVKNFKFYPVCIKKVAFICSIAIVFSASAQSADISPAQSQLPVNGGTEEAETVTVIEESRTDGDSEKSEQEEEQNHIYRKENPVNPCDRGLDAFDYEKQWYDSSQIYINSKFCEPALWFDNFFGDDRIFKEGVAGTYVRWRNDFTYDEEEAFKYKSDLNLSVELPGLQGRGRLTFEGDEDQDLSDVAPGNETERTEKLGLQLDLKENIRSKFNVKLDLSPKLQFRYRYTYPIHDRVIMRLTQEIQRDEDIHSARTLINYEHTLKQNYVFRTSTEGKLSEEYDGVDWVQAFVLYRRVNKKTSLSYETSASGITEPWTIATNYRVAVRFRQNFHREWLFYEIAPENTWPVTLDGDRTAIVKDRRSKWLLFFRLEIHFGNAAKKRYQDYY